MILKPLAFEDSGQIYKDFATKYVQHDYGLFILAPSGAGKTHFCKAQTKPHWIDGDEIWMAAKAHPDAAWWNENLEIINRVDQRSDVITMEAKSQGFWIMGASNYWLKPDAVIIPDWEKHVGWIAHREKHNYDGGAKSDQLEQVQDHIKVIKKWHDQHGVPMFKSIPEAVANLTTNR